MRAIITLSEVWLGKLLLSGAKNRMACCFLSPIKREKAGAQKVSTGSFFEEGTWLVPRKMIQTGNIIHKHVFIACLKRRTVGMLL